MVEKNAIFIVFDDLFFKFFQACITSLVKNYPEYPEILVYYEGDDGMVVEYVKQIKRVRLVSELIDTNSIECFELGVVSSRMVFIRLYLWGDSFSEYDKILYLDADTLVLNPLDSIFSQEKFYIVTDASSKSVGVFKPEFTNDQHLSSLLKADGLDFFSVQRNMYNAGVFMIEKHLRTEHNFRAILDIAQRYDGYLAFGDQSVISLWCHINGIKCDDDSKNNFQIASILAGTTDLSRFVNGVDAAIHSINILHFSLMKPEPHVIDVIQKSLLFLERFFNLFEYYQSQSSAQLQKYRKSNLSHVSLIMIGDVNSINDLMKLKYQCEFLQKLYLQLDITILLGDKGNPGVLNLLDDLSVRVISCSINSCFASNVQFVIDTTERNYVVISELNYLADPRAMISSYNSVRQTQTMMGLDCGVAHAVESTVIKENLKKRKFNPCFYDDVNPLWNFFDESEVVYNNPLEEKLLPHSLMIKKQYIAKIGGFDKSANYFKFIMKDLILKHMRSDNKYHYFNSKTANII